MLKEYLELWRKEHFTLNVHESQVEIHLDVLQ